MPCRPFSNPLRYRNAELYQVFIIQSSALRCSMVRYTYFGLTYFIMMTLNGPFGNSPGLHTHTNFSLLCFATTATS